MINDRLTRRYCNLKYCHNSNNLHSFLLPRKNYYMLLSKLNKK